MIKGVYCFDIGKMTIEEIKKRKKIKSIHNNNYRNKTKFVKP